MLSRAEWGSLAVIVILFLWWAKKAIAIAFGIGIIISRITNLKRWKHEFGIALFYIITSYTIGASLGLILAALTQ